MESIAQEIMTKPVITVRSEMLVKDLIALLYEKQISGVPVVDAEDKLVGVISISDLLLPYLDDGDDVPEVVESDFHSSPAMDRLMHAHAYLEPDQHNLDRPILAMMSRNVIAVSEQTHIAEICDQMISQRIHRVIVVDDEKVCGIISVVDILQAVRDDLFTVG